MPKKSFYNRGIILAVVMIAAFLYGCGDERPATEVKGESTRLDVTATILPVAAFTEKVGGERVSVTTLVPPGASPHTFEPTPRQLIGVAKTSALIIAGSGVEFEKAWLAKLKDMNNEMAIVDSSTGVEKDGDDDEDDDEGEEDDHGGHDHHGHSGNDPHIWVSVRNAQQMVSNIRDGLIEIDPDGRDYYTSRADDFLRELKDLDERLIEAVAKMANKKFLVYHPSWGYFAKDYGLEQIAIERGGREATPKTIVELVRAARASKLKVIIASPEFSARSAEVIAKEIDASLVLISPLEKDYVGNMERLLKAFGSK